MLTYGQRSFGGGHGQHDHAIADLGALHLVGIGESYAGPIRGLSQEKYPAGLQHALELNDIHLALN